MSTRVHGPVSDVTRKIFLANLIAQIAIVVTGGLVRLTGSGLGCPTWPRCTPGSYVPVAHQPESWHKYVEFGNRTLTFVLLILAVASLVAGIRDYRARGENKRPALLALSAVPLFGTVAQAVLGGITVLTDLHPATVATHFLLSIVIIGGCTVLVDRAGQPDDRPVVRLVRREIVWLARTLLAVGFLVLVLGTIVTGSGPHSGDAVHPARFGFDPRTVSWLHADLVLLFIGLVAGLLFALRLTEAPAAAKRQARSLAVISVVQGAVGYTQYFLGLPWVVVAAHMLLACLLWVSLVRLNLAMHARGVAVDLRSPEGATV